MTGSYSVLPDMTEDYIEFREGWPDFCAKNRIGVHDVLAVLVKVQPDGIKLIVEVVTGPDEQSDDSDDNDNDMAVVHQNF